MSTVSTPPADPAVVAALQWQHLYSAAVPTVRCGPGIVPQALGSSAVSAIEQYQLCNVIEQVS